MCVREEEMNAYSYLINDLEDLLTALCALDLCSFDTTHLSAFLCDTQDHISANLNGLYDFQVSDRDQDVVDTARAFCAVECNMTSASLFDDIQILQEQLKDTLCQRHSRS